mgnify:FL=1
MLWNAKMRFGKTLSALQEVKDMDFSRTLILTHRPVVDSGWFEDFGKIFYDRRDFAYGSKNKVIVILRWKQEQNKDNANMFTLLPCKTCVVLNL